MAKKQRAAKRATRRVALRMLIVEARFYPEISDKLLTGAVAVLEEAAATYDIVTVPGALEVPGAIAMAMSAGRYDGAVALGCVIEGETYHFEIVSNESARGLMDLAVRERLAVGNGILTVDTETQAHERLGGVEGHKGADAARAALAMVALKRALKGR
jgi:6,7-dimethyl-8-ribityllumazine synthase